MNNGEQCTTTAVNGSKFCRYHDPYRPLKESKTKSGEMEPLSLPPLVDKPSVLAALNEVVQALAEGRIKRSVADTLLSAIKLANRLITEIAQAGPSVLSTTHFHPTAVALAAPGNHSKAPFNPALRYPASQPDNDPSTARLVKELLAQSHELARSQKAKI